jgi:hypothetical protein
MLKEVAEAIEETETISGKNLRSLNRFRLLFSLFTEPRGLKRLRPRVAPKLGCEETERRWKVGNERGAPPSGGKRPRPQASAGLPTEALREAGPAFASYGGQPSSDIARRLEELMKKLTDYAACAG